MPFSVTGTYTLNESTWTDQLVYEDNNGAQIPIASPAVNIGVSSFSFTNPGLPAGNHTVTVKDPLTGNSVTSNTFVVSPAQAITANTPSGAVAGTSFNFTGTLTGFSTAPTLTYSLNSGAAVTMTGVTSSGWTTPITIATAGSYTLQVTNGSITSNTVTFTVAPVTVNHVITPNTPTGVVAGTNFTFTGTLSGYSAAPSLTYSINGGTAVAMTGVTTANWSMVIAAPATAGNYAIVVTDGTTSSSSIPFTVAAPPKVITPFTPSGVKAGVSFTFQGTLSGYTTLPALTYQVSGGGTATTLNGTSLTGWATTVTIATAGTYTITVSDGTNTGTTQSFTVTLVSTATRSFMTNPGGNGTFWVQPFATTANWITSGSLVTMVRNGNGGSNVPLGYLHSPVTEKVAPFWIAASTDPVWTVTDGTLSIQVHLPVGAYAQGLDSGDNSIGGCDPSNPYRIWCINVATMNTTTNTITGYLLSIEDASGQYFVNAVTGQLGYNNTGGLLSDYDLTQLNASSSYVIPHMLACDFDIGMVSQTVVWPLVQADPNGTGSVLPQGLTLGIPASTARPTGMSRGQAALFDQAQQYGWFMYNLSGNGCTTLNGSFPYSSSNTALLNDISNNMSWVMQFMCILNYNTVTGGQYSLATVKGMASGGTPAFTSPPPLDLSPTGGANIPPDTFGAWYSSQNGNTISPTGTFNGVTTNYNVTPTNMNPGGGTTKTITPNSPSGTIAGTSFTFTGSLAGYSSAPSLTYNIDGGTSVTMTGVTATGWSMAGVSVTTTGSHTIVVTDAVNTVSGSATFTTSAQSTNTPVTWNPSDLAGGVTLSNNNYTATSTGSSGAGAAPQSVRATQGISSTAPIVWEVQFTALTQNVNAGVADASYVLTSGGQVGYDQHGIGAYPSTGTGSQPAQTVYFNNQQLTAGNGTSSSAGDIMTLAVNGTNFFFSNAAMRTTSGVNWNNSTTADPVSNIGGFSFSGMGTPYYPIFNDSEGGAVGILNDGTKAFSTFLANYIAANPSVVTLSGQVPLVTKAITPNAPTNAVAGTPFTLTGFLTGYTTAPTLVYSLNGGAGVPITSVSPATFTATITSNLAGTNTVSVTDGTITGNTSFNVASATAGTGTFTVSNGIVVHPNGSQFIACGINVGDGYLASPNPTQILQLFPKLNFIRLEAYSYQSPTAYDAFVNFMTSRNIVVEIENHQNFTSNGSSAGDGGGGQGVIFTNANGLLQPESAWYTNLASHFKNNPYVWFGTNNEPSSWDTDAQGAFDIQGLVNWQNATYNAIRGTGSNNIIMMELSSGAGIPNTYGSANLPAAPFNGMHNIVWDFHQYSWPYNGVSSVVSQASIASQMLNYTQIAQTIKSADGIIPVIYGETGNSTSGPTIDASGPQLIAAAQQNVGIGQAAFGAAFYVWDIYSNLQGNQLRNTDGTISSYGQEVANWIAATASTNPAVTASTPLITGVTFTPASSITANSAVGTVAGTLTAASSNGALTGVTFTLNNTTNFKVVSPNVIQFNSSTVAANTYPLTVTASATNASNSSQSYNISVTVAAQSTIGPITFATPTSTGTTYYVNQATGNDGNNGTSAGSAWATLQKAASTIAAGSTVLVYNGTYSSVSFSGLNASASSWTVLKNASGQTPKIQLSLSDWQGVNIQNCSYFCVQGFEVIGTNSQLTLAGAQANNNQIPPYAQVGIVGGTSTGPLTTHHIQILNNYCHDLSQSGITIDYSDYVTICGNTCVGNALYSDYQGNGISLGYLHNYDAISGYHNYILGNLCYNNQTLIAQKSSGLITDGEGIIVDDNHNDQNNSVAYTSSTLIANNYCYNNGGSGIVAFNDSYVDIIFNTCTNNHTTASDTATGEIYVGFSTFCNVFNNLMIALPANSVFINTNSTSNNAYGNNLLYGGSSGAAAATPGSNNVIANPNLTNPPSNIIPAAGSPALGAASAAWVSNSDFYGNARPSTGAAIGAAQ